LLSLSPGAVLQAENRAYGHARALSEYSGFNRTRWVPGALQHGWNPFDGIGMFDGLWRPLPKFVWSEANARRGLERGGRNYIVIGAPWLYLLRNRATDATPGDTGSTIAFPFHATVHTRMVGSHAEYARDLMDGEGSRPLTVCLQWLDAQNPETRRAYQDVGANVITLGRGTSGAPGQESFLHRQLEVIAQHGRLVSNRLATCIFYGAAVGLEVGVYGIDMSLEGQPRYADSGLPQRWPEMHDHTVNARSASESWRHELGDDYVLDPPALRQLMGWDGGPSGAATRAAFLGRRTVDLVRLNTRADEPRHFRAY
jgi:hypothetical protein